MRRRWRLPSTIPTRGAASRPSSRRSAGRQALDRGFNAALLGSESTRTIFANERAANARALAVLLEKAHRARVVRADLHVDDIGLALRAAAAVSAASSGDPLRAVQRLAALLLEGMRAHPTR